MKQKSKSKTNITKPYAIRPKKIRKKSPKIIDYNKVAQKYGNLLETSLNTSNSIQPQKALNNNIDDSYYDYIIDNIYETNNINQENSKINDSQYYFTFKQKKTSSINNSNNNNNYDDSYYDYIIDNIYETNNINQLKKKKNK